MELTKREKELVIERREKREKHIVNLIHLCGQVTIYRETTTQSTFDRIDTELASIKKLS